MAKLINNNYIFYFYLFIFLFIASIWGCNKDNSDNLNDLASSLVGAYVGTKVGGVGTGNVDLKIKSISADEVELEFLTAFPFTTEYSVVQKKIKFKVTKGTAGVIDLTRQTQFLDVIDQKKNIMNWNVRGGGILSTNFLIVFFEVEDTTAGEFVPFWSANYNKQ